jgi:hypothetical protein
MNQSTRWLGIILWLKKKNDSMPTFGTDYENDFRRISGGWSFQFGRLWRRFIGHNRFDLVFTVSRIRESHPYARAKDCFIGKELLSGFDHPALFGFSQLLPLPGDGTPGNLEELVTSPSNGVVS